MKFAPGTFIPKGYVIELVTWENDGDNYKTRYHFGCDELDIQFFELIKPYFISHHDRRNSIRRYGNSEYDAEMAVDFIELLNQFCHLEKSFDKFLGLRLSMYDFEKDDYTSDFSHELFCDKVIKNITDYPIEYCQDFIRVLESVEIYHNANDYVVPELPLTKIRGF